MMRKVMKANFSFFRNQAITASRTFTTTSESGLHIGDADEITFANTNAEKRLVHSLKTTPATRDASRFEAARTSDDWWNSLESRCHLSNEAQRLLRNGRSWAIAGELTVTLLFGGAPAGDCVFS